MNVINQTQASEKIKSGLPVIFQTDTLPAIGCLPKFSEIIYEIKKRDLNKPLILMGAENYQLNEFVQESALVDFKYMSSKYWPGALTMVVPISKAKKSFLTSCNLTIGLRIPNSISAKSFLKKTGPLLTSSANISGLATATSVEALSIELPNVDIVGPLPWEKCSGKASTIISWVNNGKWKLIREGHVLISGVG